ncbi:MAG: hypothetical protein DRJ60_00155 [Thermoprotei archaeon]|nr:hypothetical protein [Candidatus Culexmicrobium cathedralense]RLF08508.1 MAG: hypothetical protein DRJ60_00155 [Thermoprotei archaeon]
MKIGEVIDKYIEKKLEELTLKYGEVIDNDEIELLRTAHYAIKRFKFKFEDGTETTIDFHYDPLTEEVFKVRES